MLQLGAESISANAKAQGMTAVGMMQPHGCDVSEGMNYGGLSLSDFNRFRLLGFHFGEYDVFARRTLHVFTFGLR